MRIFNINRGIPGSRTLQENALRFAYMISKEAQQRAKILTFWKKHGLSATKEAFEVSRATLFRWKASLNKQKGKLEALNNKSRAPKKRRKRVIPDEVKDAIVRERYFDPHIGKDKLAIILKKDGVIDVSSSTVGRMLNNLKQRGLLPNPQPLSFNGRTGKHHKKRIVKRKRLRRTTKRGMEIDTIVRFINGTKRYILTAVDVERRFAFAGAYTSHSSLSASDFLTKLTTVCPFPITEVQTDNGSEFAKYFEHLCTELNITHYHTYPRCPKMNSHVERFNRTVSESFIQYHRGLLSTDLDAFNKELVDWLIWYNTRRPHWSLGLKSPMQYIVSTLSEKESHMLWTSTLP